MDIPSTSNQYSQQNVGQGQHSSQNRQAENNFFRSHNNPISNVDDDAVSELTDFTHVQPGQPGQPGQPDQDGRMVLSLEAFEMHQRTQ